MKNKNRIAQLEGYVDEMDARLTGNEDGLDDLFEYIQELEYDNMYLEAIIDDLKFELRR